MTAALNPTPVKRVEDAVALTNRIALIAAQEAGITESPLLVNTVDFGRARGAVAAVLHDLGVPWGVIGMTLAFGGAHEGALRCARRTLATKEGRKLVERIKARLKEAAR